jgi:hypothetical protein
VSPLPFGLSAAGSFPAELAEPFSSQPPWWVGKDREEEENEELSEEAPAD